jgi:hypothetical protein
MTTQAHRPHPRRSTGQLGAAGRTSRGESDPANESNSPRSHRRCPTTARPAARHGQRLFHYAPVVQVIHGSLMYSSLTRSLGYHAALSRRGVDVAAPWREFGGWCPRRPDSPTRRVRPGRGESPAGFCLASRTTSARVSSLIGAHPVSLRPGTTCRPENDDARPTTHPA